MTASPPNDRPLLIVAAAALPERVLDALRRRHGAERAVLLDLKSTLGAGPLPAPWQRVAESELLDSAGLRRDFLAMLERWPARPLIGGRSFDELFRHADGYSLWWTGPGASRQPTRGPLVPSCRALWVTERAIEQFAPRQVTIYATNRRLAAMLASQALQAGCAWSFAPGSVRPAGSPWRGRAAWLLASLLAVALQPVWISLRALWARWLAGRPVESPDQQGVPAVVMTGWYPQHVRAGSDGPRVWYWRQLAAALAQLGQPVRARYLLHQNRFRFSGWRHVLTPIHTGWRALRRVPDLVPLHQAQFGLRGWWAALPVQFRSLARYASVEAQETFRQSFQFAGADVSWLFAPALRSQVASITKWGRNVDAVAASLAAVGSVRAVLVHEEFYPKGMLTIAAARRLGIPTVGVQHGTLSPEHLVYCIPAGQVAGSPLPDYFAAYGPFAAEVVSEHGHYPRQRVWIAGGARFDHLVGKLPDRAAARGELNLPDDRFLVLLATQQYDWSRKPAEALFQAVRDDPSVLVLVKTHPNERKPERYLALAEQCGAHNVRCFRDRFDELLAACDVLVSRSSTTLLEAILAGRPTICTNFSDEPQRYPYVSEGGSLGADSPESVRAALARLRDGAADLRWSHLRQQFLLRHLGPTAHGAAAATTARLIAEHFLSSPAHRRCA